MVTLTWKYITTLALLTHLPRESVQKVHHLVELTRSAEESMAPDFHLLEGEEVHLQQR